MCAWLNQRVRAAALLALISVVLFFLPPLSSAAQVSLAWEPTHPVPEGYRLYQRTEGQPYNYSLPSWVGTQSSTTVEGLADQTRYYFVVRAYAGEIESADSNEVTVLTPAPAATTYTITVNAGPNGTISPAESVQVNAGADQTFTFTPHSGYRVGDVSVDGLSKGALASYTFNQVQANHTIHALFAADQFTITATAGSNGAISPAGNVMVPFGASQTFSISANLGYQIEKVLIDGVPAGTSPSHVFANVSKNHSIAVDFVPRQYTLTAVAGDGGTISPAGQKTVNHGASQTYTLSATNGYEIQDLAVNGQSLGKHSSYLIPNIQNDYFIEARFAPINQPPTADAGPNQAVDEGQTVRLSGKNSFDPDDGIAAFQWRQIQGESVVLTHPDQAETTFTAPSVGPSGSALVFELAVTDFSNATTVDTCIVNVSWVNEPPTANAGDRQIVTEGMTVILDAIHSFDPDDGIAAYRWKQLQGPAVTLADDQSALASFTAPATGPEGASLTFELTVTDAGGLQDTDTCLVSVEWVNTPPLADAGLDQQVDVGDPVYLDGSNSSDPDGQDLAAYHWRQLAGPPVELSDPTAAIALFQAPAVGLTGAAVTFKLTVTDSGGLQDEDSTEVFVHPPEPLATDTTPPSLIIDIPAKDPVTINRFSIHMSGRAWDNQAVERVIWRNSRGGSGTATGTSQWEIQKLNLKYGANTITVTAIDTAGNETTVSKTVTVRLRWWW